MFQAFSQADYNTSRRFGGTGLGLVISRKLADLMGGRAWVESEIGKGSKFYFSVPAGVPKGAERVRWQEGEVSPLAGIRVWIVDDNDTNRRICGAAPSPGAWWCAIRPSPQSAWVGDYRRRLRPRHSRLRYAGDGRRAAGRRTAPVARDSVKQLMLSSLGTVLDAATAQQIGLLAQLVKPVRHSALFDASSSSLAAKATRSALAKATTVLPADLAQRLPLRILIAEDNPINVKLITIIMKRLGYRVDVAGNGLEVIAALRRQPYDVVLMDVQCRKWMASKPRVRFTWSGATGGVRASSR